MTAKDNQTDKNPTNPNPMVATNPGRPIAQNIDTEKKLKLCSKVKVDASKEACKFLTRRKRDQ